MSKKHHNNNGGNNMNQEQKKDSQETTPVVAAAAPAETTVEQKAEEVTPANGEQQTEQVPGPVVEPAQKEASVEQAPADRDDAEQTSDNKDATDKTQHIKIPKEKIMSSDIIKDNASGGTAFAAKRAMALAGSNHTDIGRKLIRLLDEYAGRMMTPSYDKTENVARINMLYKILITACPPAETPIGVANDVVRIMFDKFMEGWGTVYTDNNIFRLGNQLKVSPIEADRLVIFVNAFTQMIEGIADKKRVMFDEARLQKLLNNVNVANAMCRLRDNINKKLGFE